jgi:tetratricopeptide (TPR) repeat protein
MLAASHFSWNQGDWGSGKALVEQALGLHDEHGLPGTLYLGAINLAVCEYGLGNRKRALDLYESALSAARAEGDDIVVATILNNLGNTVLTEGDLAAARPYIEESTAMNRRLKRGTATSANLIDLGFIALAESHLEEAAAAIGESLALCRAHRYVDTLIWVVEASGALALDRGDAVRAARLLAATTRPRAELGFAGDFYPIGETSRRRTAQGAREELGEAAFAEAWSEGEKLSLDEAAELAALDLSRPE